MKEFAFLVATAVALYFLKWPILVVAVLAFFFVGLSWLCRRWPRTMLVVLGFLSGLLGRR
jgi:hypothetical protein